MHEFDKMLKWVQEGGGRRVITIEIGANGDASYLHKWAYDYDLQTGQSFNSIDEVNLQKIKETEEQVEYIRLKQKFEKGV